MSPPVRQLRRADEQQLQVVGTALERGRFAIVVADDAVWPLVRRALGVEPAGSFALETGDDVVKMFALTVSAGEGVVFLQLGEQATGAMAALNLNRDKLTSRSCRFLLRLAGLEAYRRFVREAPDAYSVRDAAALIETQEVVDLGTSPEGEPEAEVERRIAEEGSGDALLNLGNSLLDAGRWQVANCAFERGIALLTRKKRLSSSDRSLLAALHYHRGRKATSEGRHFHVKEALRVLEPARGEFEEQYINILRYSSDYFGTKIGAVREALRAAEQRIPPNTDHILLQMSALAQACHERDDIRGAREALGRLSPSRWTTQHNRLHLRQMEAGVLRDEGRWREARTELEDALRNAASSNHRAKIEVLAVQLARLLVNQGEPEAGVDVIVTINTEAADDLRLRVRRSQGEPDAFRDLEAPAYVPPPHGDLSRALTRAAEDARWVRLAVRAGLLQQDVLPRMNTAIDALVAHVAEVAPTDPPWSRIDAELLVADQHLARMGDERAASDAAERGLVLARRGSPELVPACARRLAVAALRSGSTERLEALLDEAAQAAEAHHLPGEAARIAGLSLWQAVQEHGALDRAEKALEEAFERSGSVLVQAEVLLRTGRGAGRPDLVSRARRIYRSLPWPEREGACLEALGMVDIARARYKAFGLRLAATALDGSPTPEPVDA